MNPVEPASPFQLKIDAHVLWQLGAELITSPLIAVMEFVKNSHDANASWCLVRIDPDYQEDIEVIPSLYKAEELTWYGDKAFKTFKGKISVSDDGWGMDQETLQKSWLTVSYSNKREKKKVGEKVAEGKRNYTGDKGLGRLGSMQIASICRLDTMMRTDTSANQLTINWDQIREGITLDQILIKNDATNKEFSTQHGTTISLIGLRDLHYWRNESQMIDFKYFLAASISPFGFFEKKQDKFKVSIRIKDKEETADSLIYKVLDSHASAYTYQFDGKQLRIKGKSILLSFESQTNRADFASYVLTDNGQAFYNFLEKDAKLGKYLLKRSEGTKYFIEWESIKSYDEIKSSGNPENPGAFEAEVYDFIYNLKDIPEIQQDLSRRKFTDLIKDYLSGIVLYRDGFKIGSGREDWLKLSYERTSGEGSYSLRTGNIAGHVDITSDNNLSLTDASNREGLVENAAQKYFYAINETAIEEINNFRNLSRRALNKFFENIIAAENKQPSNPSPQQAVQILKDTTKKVRKTYNTLHEKQKTSERSFIKKAAALEGKISSAQDLLTDPKHLNILKDLQKDLEELKTIHLELQKDCGNISLEIKQMESNVDAIHSHINSYEEQMKRFYHHVAIGLSAQFLAHDVNSQISNLSHDNKSIKTIAKSLSNTADRLRLSSATSSIDGHLQALSKTAANLNPLLQAQREEKHTIVLVENLSNYKNYISPFLEKDSISLDLIIDTNHPKIQFNKGKFFQVIDNIVRNSQYWLKNYANYHPEVDKKIYFKIDGYEITIWDTGIGFRPGIERSMFDMFITEKPDGQGLGLFIVKSLLESNNCSIYVLDEKNIHNRNYKLVLNMSGAAI